MFRRKPSAPNTADAQQIFQKFLEFLETDMWLLPISNFMEQNSIAFEREQGNPDTFEKIYKKFTELVDTLIDSYCQDTGIKGKQLVEALKSTDNSSKLSFKDKVLLEPIVAAQDFNIFVPMMMRKNIELQLQALKMLEHLSGLLPSSLKLDEDDAEVWKVLFDEDESERLILISVLKQSREEFEQNQRIREEWQQQLDTATHNSIKEKQLLESMKKKEQKRLDEAMKMTEEKFKNMSIGGADCRVSNDQISHTTTEIQESKNSNSSPLCVLPKHIEQEDGVSKGVLPTAKPTKSGFVEEGKTVRQEVPVNYANKNKGAEKSKNEKPDDNDLGKDSYEQTDRNHLANANRRTSLGKVKHHQNNLLKNAAEEANHEYGYRALLKDKEQIPEELVRQRAQYLKEQRDKLLGMKKKQREIQFMESSKKTASERPRTAKVARGALAMSNAAEDEALDSLSTRRNIAAKIKADVMHFQT